jgi:putative transposase
LRGRRRYAADFRALDAAAEARGILHHSALRARQALASGYPVPDVGPLALRQAIYEAFAVGSAISPVEQLIEDRTPRPASAARGAAGRGSSCASLSAKAESDGRTVIALNLRHTSQRCAECGRTPAGNRITQAEFRCLACGHQAEADVNATRNILRAGLALREA